MTAILDRNNFSQVWKRDTAFEPKIDEASRTVELSFSSEFAADRGGYMEVLSHDPADVNLSRLNSKHPLLLNHDPDQLIGVVEAARVDSDKKARAVVRFSTSQKAEEVWRDVVSGIRALVSTGYRRTRELSSETRDGREFVRFAWEPFEISLVSVPCDPGVGVGRSEPAITPPEVKIERATIMPEQIETKESRHDPKALFKMANALRGRVDDIDSLLQKAIDGEWTEDKFRAEALNRLPEAKPMQKPAVADIPARDWNRYSITKAIVGLMENRLDGLEREVSDEMARTHGPASGVWVPSQVFARNFVQGTTTLGGMLTSSQYMGDQFIELLRNRAKVLSLGARTLQLTNTVLIPRQNGAGSTNWVAETAAATLSTGNFGQITLTPFGLSAFQQYSKQLLFQSNPSIDALVRDDIMSILALEIDRVALHGAGTTQPLGIAGTSGIGAVAMGANAAAFTSANAYPAVVSLETEVAIDNADIGNLAYLTNAKVRGKLKTVDMSAAANTAQWVWRPDNTLNGYKAEVSNQVSSILTKGTATTICSAVFFGNWSDLLVAQFGGGVDLIVDPYVLAANAVVRVIARTWVDVGVRHPESFSILPDVLAG